MGKLVKYCDVCEEGFAERFGFCPNCGGHLASFEMNPVVKEAETAAIPVAENSGVSNFIHAEESSAPVAETSFIPETTEFSGDDILELDSVDTRETVIEKEPETLAATVASVSESENNYQSDNFSDGANFSKNNADSGYHVTVVSEKSSSWFNSFLLGLMTFALVAAFGSYAAAIWFFGPGIPEVEGVNLALYSDLSTDEPMEIEEVKKIKEEEGGGGGGGGKKNPDPLSKGRVPDQSNISTPIMPLPVMENPSIPINNTTKGTNRREQTNEQVGDPNSLSSKISSGNGDGNGFGNGKGDGYGNGRGNGEGNGNGSGSGNGIGNGNGDGLGDGDGDRNTPQVTKKVVPVGETKGVTITSKPTPRYTDAARQNNVQGTVTLRVTFNANGTIGGVSPVNSLPNGLTEQAISAAKQIRFQPAMRNGQAYAVTKQVVYSFTIY